MPSTTILYLEQKCGSQLCPVHNTLLRTKMWVTIMPSTTILYLEQKCGSQLSPVQQYSTQNKNVGHNYAQYNNFQFRTKMWVTVLYLAHLTKDRVSFCHHFPSVICHDCLLLFIYDMIFFYIHYRKCLVVSRNSYDQNYFSETHVYMHLRKS